MQDRAALVLHEAIYKMVRDNRAKTSDETRLVIGFLFSNKVIPRMWSKVKPVLTCNAGFGNGQNDQLKIRIRVLLGWIFERGKAV